MSHADPDASPDAKVTPRSTADAAPPNRSSANALDAETLRGEVDQFVTDFHSLESEIRKVIVGQQEIVRQVLMALIAGGHVLLEGVPGLGKTLLVRTLANALHSDFSRIQFTPDMMPADMIGTNVFVESPDGHRGFRFQRGPIFANIVLADEVNRATPKTQSALLEAMQEHSVTVAGTTHPLQGLFFVLATQNPLEMEGTYPLPEAQLDRFFFKLLVRFPTTADLEQILDRTTEATRPTVQPLFEGTRILEMSRLVRQVPIASEVRQHAIALVMGTHPESEQAADVARQYVRYGSSPRGAQALILAAKIQTLLDGRVCVAREDVRQVAHAALRHRLILNFEGQAEAIQADDIIDAVLAQTR